MVTDRTYVCRWCVGDRGIWLRFVSSRVMAKALASNSGHSGTKKQGDSGKATLTNRYEARLIRNMASPSLMRSRCFATGNCR
jgi:hypothetical protein